MDFWTEEYAFEWLPVVSTKTSYDKNKYGIKGLPKPKQNPRLWCTSWVNDNYAVKFHVEHFNCPHFQNWNQYDS